MFSPRNPNDEWTLKRWRQPNVGQIPVEFLDNTEPDDETPQTPLWKDLTVASGMALALWAIAAVLFLG